MEYIAFFNKSREIREHLDRNETDAALRLSQKLLRDHPDRGLAWYLAGRCYEQKKDIFHSIESYTRCIRTDPAFLSAAEKLLELNKDNYSVGELKYLYSLIVNHKEGGGEMYRFLRKFSDAPPEPQLTVPDLSQDELAADELPGTDDNAYIQHLIRGMDKLDRQPGAAPEAHPAEAKTPPETESALPADYQPPPKQPPPPKNNDKPVRIRSYGIETMTMARMYIRQGLYDNAMDILLKLQEKDPGSERVKSEIRHLKERMEEEKERT
jgi:tetratricopeptide (TPR) repeat protein